MSLTTVLQQLYNKLVPGSSSVVFSLWNTVHRNVMALCKRCHYKERAGQFSEIKSNYSTYHYYSYSLESCCQPTPKLAVVHSSPGLAKGIPRDVPMYWRAT